ncbi:hypothetical protein SPBR_08552 [Sporothrix brasiliensis 5110]|uniref:Ureidoglycolate hydrolase n=1 Tax=Sporothrix brasiliensis 5110 TaxID=1398154 RepID=A0A0C2EKX1_9PEZI|nr:uncharacterized protein SPBR_08552 [Sporothrix brasiliensis 5110]KIH86714.1 hypothetical protein SPBR_08552 [Sporothrix brasiliensis 5110]
MAALVPTDARNQLQDLSGIVIQPGENPYVALINACDNDPAKIQKLYETHRTLRNQQQRAKFLDPAFTEVLVDPFLIRIENPSIDPSFADPRHGLVFWARPPEHVLQLTAHVQSLLQKAGPRGLWLMPTNRQHMTALEITHSKTPAEAFAVVDKMAKSMTQATADDGSLTAESGIASIVNYPYAHRARLVKPMLSYDLSAVALSFVPAAGEPRASPAPIPPAQNTAVDAVGDAYTYHHLRRDLFDRAQATGVEVASRYVVPSAHITLGRFIGQDDHATPEARQAWVDTLDEINAWLEKEVWDKVWELSETDSDIAGVSGYRKPDLPPPHRRLVGEWVVGQERGLDARTGALWYGGGRSVMVGQGF